MKTNIHFWSYLAQFFLEWEMFQTKVVEKIKTHISCSVTFFFRKSCRLWDNVGKYCRAGQATDNNVALSVPCWIPKATNTHSEYVILIAFPLQACLQEGACILRYAYIACLVLMLHKKHYRLNPPSPRTGCTFNSICILDLRPTQLTTRYSEAILFICRGLPEAGSGNSR